MVLLLCYFFWEVVKRIGEELVKLWHDNFWSIGHTNTRVLWAFVYNIFNCQFFLTISDNCGHSISQHVRRFPFIDNAVRAEMPSISNNLLFFLHLLFRYDIKVSLKKKYNDAYKSSKGFLSGNEWYCHQAFRALNQAAGMPYFQSLNVRF